MATGFRTQEPAQGPARFQGQSLLTEPQGPYSEGGVGGVAAGSPMTLRVKRGPTRKAGARPDRRAAWRELWFLFLLILVASPSPALHTINSSVLTAACCVWACCDPILQMRRKDKRGEGPHGLSGRSWDACEPLPTPRCGRYLEAQESTWAPGHSRVWL